MYGHPGATPPKTRRLPRFWICTVIAIALLAALAVVAPHQLPVVLYKCGLVTLGAVLGYWIDRNLFPYSRPHEATCVDRAGAHWARSMAMLRRAIVVLACVLGLTLGL